MTRAEAKDRVRRLLGAIALVVIWAFAQITLAQSHSSQTGAHKKRVETANECLARGDNECVVRALEGWAHTQEELGLLIETYRALKQDERARQVMRTYVERYPDAARSSSYRRMLGATSPPAAASTQAATAKPGADAARSQVKSARELAGECLAVNDNPCIVRALAGNAQSADDFALLIETYRVLGDEPHAREVMQDLIARFPSSQYSARYRHALEQSAADSRKP